MRVHLKHFWLNLILFLEHGTVTELRDLYNELNIMASVGNHPNVVSLIGACSEDGKFELFGKLEDFYFLPPHLAHLTFARSVAHADKASPLPQLSQF